MSCQLFKAIRPAAVATIYFFRDLQRECAVFCPSVFLRHRGSASFLLERAGKMQKMIRKSSGHGVGQSKLSSY